MSPVSPDLSEFKSHGLTLENTTRHLIYHITPIRGSGWRKNLEWLARSIHIFNGSRSFAVAQPPRERSKTPGKVAALDSMDKVVEALDKLNGAGRYTAQAFDNDLQLRETATFPWLLDRAKAGVEAQPRTMSMPVAEPLVFYGHTKGVTYTPKSLPRGIYEATQMWTRLSYFHNLEQIHAVLGLLTYYPICGAFKRYGDNKQFKGFPDGSTAHFAGSFFWMKWSELIKRDWQTVPTTRFGVEAYPNTLFAAHEMGCVFAEGVQNPYDLREIKRLCGADRRQTTVG